MTFKINEMAYSKKEVLNKLASLSEPLCYHILKCIVYNNLQSVNFWIKEIAGFLYTANSYKIKSGSVSKEEYIKNLYNNSLPNELEDADSILLYYKNYLRKSRSEVLINKKVLPDFEITDELRNNFINSFKSVVEKSFELFNDKETHTTLDYYNLVKSILTK